MKASGKRETDGSLGAFFCPDNEREIEHAVQ